VDVWNILWSELHQPLTDADWGFIRMLGSSKWDEVERAAIARRVLEGKPRHGGRVRRVDLLVFFHAFPNLSYSLIKSRLGDKCIFLGLERDDDFARRRLLPGENTGPETWMVKLGSLH
jgi:hypothetical protein